VPLALCAIYPSATACRVSVCARSQFSDAPAPRAHVDWLGQCLEPVATRFRHSRTSSAHAHAHPQVKCTPRPLPSLRRVTLLPILRSPPPPLAGDTSLPLPSAQVRRGSFSGWLSRPGAEGSALLVAVRATDARGRAQWEAAEGCGCALWLGVGRGSGHGGTRLDGRLRRHADGRAAPTAGEGGADVGLARLREEGVRLLGWG
jgi:hypothetical protein